jgi:micrococcal nuclease
VTKKILVIGLIALMGLAAYFVLFNSNSPSDETFEVKRVIDGDTIELSNGDRVRLIGINTPETGQPYYSEATEKLKQLLGDNPITMEKDEDDKDQYNRLLRYIYVNDTFVNLEMVRSGYALAYDYEPNTKYSEEMHDAELEARNAQSGIWAPSTFTISISLLHYDAGGGDDSLNLNDEYVVFENEGSVPIDMEDWTVQDESNKFYTFPEFSLVNGTSVTLYTGSGTNTAVELYWENPDPIWNNAGDSLYLRDSEGLLVAYYTY